MQSFRHQLAFPSLRNLLSHTPSTTRPLRSIHASSVTCRPRKGALFSSNATLQQESSPSSPPLPTQAVKDPINAAKQKRKAAGKTSLKRVALEAQRPRTASITSTPHEEMNIKEANNTVTAISVADQFDMDSISQILRSHGFPIDPDDTGFDSDQVIHTRGSNNGDIFVFPSGSVVAWSLPADVVTDLATKTLLPAALNPHLEQMETEDLEFKEDPKRDNCSIKNDVITLGTRTEEQASSKLDITLAKIAFSSGLARSTKLAVLETTLGKYFESTRKIPSLLARGSKLPISSQIMLRKTGELLELRAQLNHYSELTDSLPDLFWDSKHELGLGGYYDQVGRALDVGVRIKTLNEKLDYAQETASILRQTMSEQHSIRLEWVIIILIAVEVVFGIRHIWKDIEREKLEDSMQNNKPMEQQAVP